MPTTYTHYRFGAMCLERLEPRLRRAAARGRGLFDLGVHGPDVFFYYRPLKKNQVSDYGNQLHRLPARSFFEKARPVFVRCRDREAMMAYLLGFLSHFVLDSTCHGYVEEARKSLGISHNRLEAYLDSRMMEEDGLTPSQVNRGFSLKPSPYHARIMARFFDAAPETVLAASRGQVQVMNLLCSPRGVKKRLARGLIRGLHVPGSFDDLFIDDEIPEEYREAVASLEKLYGKALEEYGALACSLADYLRGAGDLPERFDRNFE